MARAFASNRSKRGIYAGKDIRFGNNISFSHRKTRRTFKPNAQRKRLWSEALGCWLRFNITTHALRCIDRAGGIDAYLLATPDAKLGSIAGANARRMIEAARGGEGSPTVRALRQPGHRRAAVPVRRRAGSREALGTVAGLKPTSTLCMKTRQALWNLPVTPPPGLPAAGEGQAKKEQ